MRGDYSRFTFDPRKRYSGVLLQQGRVLTDADWNEQAEIVDRRLRALVIDCLGRVAVSPRTPDAFRIELGAEGMTIGRGRMYVDGLLAENHGMGAPDLDPALGEVRGSAATLYERQPFETSPGPVPTGPAPFLVFLEVWQREVTPAEDPDLVDPALGAETSTRIQVAWRVGILPDLPPSATCGQADRDLPGWAELARPSAGRLSTGTAAGGYRGLENRLYRVEIHRAGGPGEATFTWSRAGKEHPPEVVPAGAVELEDGVEVRFETAGQGGFRAGDHWLFAARTADGSVQRLEASPSRGGFRHLCRLAVVGPGGAVEDCRPPPVRPLPGPARAG